MDLFDKAVLFDVPPIGINNSAFDYARKQNMAAYKRSSRTSVDIQKLKRGRALVPSVGTRYYGDHLDKFRGKVLEIKELLDEDSNLKPKAGFYCHKNI